MSLLFETILILDGEIKNLPYHHRRLNKSRATFFSSTEEIDLKNYICIPKYFQKGYVKCRVSYDEYIRSVSYSYYTPRRINSLKIISDNTIDYAHKFEDRLALKTLFNKRAEHSEILIIKNGLVTDCFYYNVALYRDSWYTPASPLLPGTMRASLIEKKKITPIDISLEEIPSYSKICLFNSLNPFGEIVLPIKSIF